MSYEQIGPVDVDVCEEESSGDEPALYISVNILNGKKSTCASVHVVGTPTEEDIASALHQAVLGSAANYGMGVWMAFQRMLSERSG